MVNEKSLVYYGEAATPIISTLDVQQTSRIGTLSIKSKIMATKNIGQGNWVTSNGEGATRFC
jgi:hypothetical protein